MRAGRKRFWYWMFLGVVLAWVAFALPPVRLEWHKWRLAEAKARKERLLSTPPRTSWTDRVWAQVTGRMPEVRSVDRTIQRHEEALVRVGFLKREMVPREMITACQETRETLLALRKECPWYDAEVVATNLLVTACPKRKVYADSLGSPRTNPTRKSAETRERASRNANTK